MLYIASDHGGFAKKNALLSFLKKRHLRVYDLGPKKLMPQDDYPLMAKKIALAVRRSRNHRGLALCRTGAGMVIASNKIPGIRAIQANDVVAAKSSRLDEDANILCLAADRLTIKKMVPIVLAFISTRFSRASRHKRRLQQIKSLENEVS